MEKNNCPEPVELFKLNQPVEIISEGKWNQKSLFENIVNPRTAKQFIESGANRLRIIQLVNNHKLFESENFSELWHLVTELAEQNKTMQNISYSYMPDPYSDNYQTLSMEGWRRHILNLLNCIRADYTSFIAFQRAYIKWREIYRIYCSGSDPEGLTLDLNDIGY